MAGRIIPLSEPRRLSLDYNRRLIIPIRRDITDYGPPGAHGLGPQALKGHPRAAALGIPGAEGLDGAGGLEGILGCLGSHQESFRFVQSVAASTILVEASQFLPTPFIIAHLSVLTNSNALDLHAVYPKYSQDNSLTGGNQTSGIDILTGSATGHGMGGFNIPQHWYPNKVVPDGYHYLKVSYDNSTAGTIRFELHFDLIYP